MANFIRWNPTSHIYELSTNDGASFSPLPLNASIINEGTLTTTVIPPLDASKITTGVFGKAQLPASIAYEDEANVFTQNQRLICITPELELIDISAAVDKKWIDILNYEERIHFRSRSDAGGWINSPLQIKRTGDILVSQDIYEKNRTTPVGHWTSFTPGFATYPAGTWTVPGANILSCRYSLTGKTAVWQIWLGPTTVTAGVSHLAIGLPIDANAYHCSCPIRINGGAETGFGYHTPGDGFFYLNRLGSTAWPTTISGIDFTLPFFVP